MSTDINEYAQLQLRMLAASIAGDKTAVLDAYEAMGAIAAQEPDGGAALSFATVWGFATLIAQQADPDKGPVMRVEVTQMRGTDDAVGSEASQVCGALIAAAGNDHGHAAAELWFALDPEVAGRVTIDLLGLTSAVWEAAPP